MWRSCEIRSDLAARRADGAKRCPHCVSILRFCALLSMCAIGNLCLWSVRLHAASIDGVTHGLDQWRVAQNDGLNCLYLQLRLIGTRAEYSKYRVALGNSDEYRSLQSLAVAARQFGVKAEPLLLSSAELRTLRLPILVHLEARGLGSGGFCLYLGQSDDSVTLVKGDTMEWCAVGRDEFERSWTGYALVLSPRSGMAATIRRVGCVVAVFIFGICIFLKWKR